MWDHEHLWLSRGALISVHASAFPARSHPQLLYLKRGGGNHFRRCLFYQKRLSTKLTLVKQFEKMTWRRGEGNRNPWVSGQRAWWWFGSLRPCVSERVSDDYLADREPRFKHTAWQHPRRLQHTYTHMHPTPNLPSAAALRIYGHNHYYHAILT